MQFSMYRVLYTLTPSFALLVAAIDTPACLSTCMSDDSISLGCRLISSDKDCVCSTSIGSFIATDVPPLIENLLGCVDTKCTVNNFGLSLLYLQEFCGSGTNVTEWIPEKADVSASTSGGGVLLEFSSSTIFVDSASDGATTSALTTSAADTNSALTTFQPGPTSVSPSSSGAAASAPLSSTTNSEPRFTFRTSTTSISSFSSTTTQLSSSTSPSTKETVTPAPSKMRLSNTAKGLLIFASIFIFCFILVLFLYFYRKKAVSRRFKVNHKEDTSNSTISTMTASGTTLDEQGKALVNKHPMRNPQENESSDQGFSESETGNRARRLGHNEHTARMSRYNENQEAAEHDIEMHTRRYETMAIE